jgi:replicative DNA helicase
MSEVTQLPASIDAERALLGGILLSDGKLYPDVAAQLEPEDFSLDSNRRIFRSMGEMKGPIDLVTLTEHMHNELESIGGAGYISSLTDGTPKLDNVDFYAQLVKGKAELRKLAKIGQWTTARALDADGETTEDLAAAAQRQLLELSGAERGGFYEASAILKAQFRSIDAIHEAWETEKGILTGFRKLDDQIAGLHPAELFILASRPSLGKTSLALNIAANIALSTKQTVAIFSLEMTARAVILRMICSEARVNSHLLEKGFANQSHRRALAGAAGVIAGLPLHIDDQADIRPETMLARAKALKSKTGSLALVVVDYLQLITIGSRGRLESRYQEISYVSRFMKQMAKELDCPVLALSQLNRAPEDRAGPPRLSDLRESGQLEQDADVVLFLWKEEYRGKTHPSRDCGADPVDDYTVKATIAKQRNGPVGTFDLVFLRQYCRFENYAGFASEEAS